MVKAHVWDVASVNNSPPETSISEHNAEILDEKSHSARDPSIAGNIDSTLNSNAAEFSLPDGVKLGSVDIVLLVFIFSALCPDQWAATIENIWHALKPGGLVLFRDYARGDLAQVRFRKGRWLAENFYVRGDGTRVYFFDKEELCEIWTGPTGEKDLDSGGDDLKVSIHHSCLLVPSRKKSQKSSY